VRRQAALPPGRAIAQVYMRSMCGTSEPIVRDGDLSECGMIISSKLGHLCRQESCSCVALVREEEYYVPWGEERDDGRRERVEREGKGPGALDAVGEEVELEVSDHGASRSPVGSVDREALSIVTLGSCAATDPDPSPNHRGHLQYRTVLAWVDVVAAGRGATWTCVFPSLIHGCGC